VSNSAPKRKAVFLFFLLILLWQVAFNTLLLPQHSFRKYSLNAQRFIEHPFPDERLMDFSPFYFSIHVALNLVHIPSWTIVPFLQIFLSASALYLLYKTLLKLVSPATALGTALLAALYPAYNLYVFCQEPEALLLFLNILGVYFTLARPSPLGGGLAFTLSVLTRPSAFPLALLAGMFQKHRRGLYYLPLACGILLLLGFSWWATGSPTLSYMSPGTVFYEGNNPHATGVASAYPPVIKSWENAFEGKESDFAHTLYRKSSAAEAGLPLSLSAHQALWMGKALRWGADHPLSWGRLLLNKLWSAAGNREVHDIFSLVLVEEKLGPFRRFGFGIFFALGLTGLLAFRGRIPALIWIGAGWTTLTLLLFYFTSRQRMGLFAFLLFLVAFGLESFKRSRLWIASVGLLLAFSFIPAGPVRAYLDTFKEIKTAGGLRNRVTEAFSAKDPPEASRQMTLCIRQAPYLALYHSSPFLAFEGGSPFSQALRLPEKPADPYNLGLLYFNVGDYPGALRAFEKIRSRAALKHYYAIEPPLYFIAVCHAQSNRPDEAQKDVQEALCRFPGNGPVMALARALGRDEDLLRYHDLLSASWYLGRACFHLGQYDKALPHFEKLVETAPELLTAREYLGICCARTGNFKGMAAQISAIVSCRNEASLIPQWQEITREMEARFSGDPLYADLLTRMRILFPKPL
jgi:tetratricopeptide (TPR) repeat protein